MGLGGNGRASSTELISVLANQGKLKVLARMNTPLPEETVLKNFMGIKQRLSQGQVPEVELSVKLGANEVGLVPGEYASTLYVERTTQAPDVESISGLLTLEGLLVIEHRQFFATLSFHPDFWEHAALLGVPLPLVAISAPKEELVASAAH